jgi:hypothetical protein
MANTVSMDMSIGREVTVDVDALWEETEDNDAELVEWSAACSWAE